MPDPGIEHVDVVVVGAGLSGIGAGYRLQEQSPDHSYVILEGRESLGGTWDLFKYPGIRSDSDIFTLGYPFKPWKGEKSIADGADILAYIRETAEENGIDRHIRFGHKVTKASWSSDTHRWTITADRTDGSGPATFSASFLFLCSGYYSYDNPYEPDFDGKADFQGEWVLPQFWPEDLDYAGKEVVVIGSGATAVTVVPSMAKTAKHVTMLQRSPTYIMSLPGKDPVANLLRKVLPADLAHRIIRRKNVLQTLGFYQFCRKWPEAAKKLIKGGVKRRLPKDVPVEPHFSPKYDPWDQRLCLVPGGDFFRSMRAGKASVVTDTIERITPTGIQLTSGKHLDADIIVCATGLNLQMAGGAEFEMDGKPIEVSDRYMYRGHMLSGVPNAAMALGYTNASWTLRADLTWQAVTRLLNHMQAHGYTSATPVYDGPKDAGGSVMGLTSGYVTRSADLLPRQGVDRPWLVRQNYLQDSRDAKQGSVTEAMKFERLDPSAPAVLESAESLDDVPDTVDDVAEEAVASA